MMGLGDWLRIEGISHIAFARDLAVSRVQVERWAKAPQHPRHVTPRPAMVVKIFEITGGAVAPNDHYDLPLEITIKGGAIDAAEIKSGEPDEPVAGSVGA